MSRQRLCLPYHTALVTGASSGLGRPIAEAQLEVGLTVYGTARQPDPVGADPRLHWLPLEGASPNGVSSFIRANSAMLTNFDILVNNMGEGLWGRLSSWEGEDLAGNLRLLLEGPVRLTAAVVPGMRERGRGVVVNVSSMAAELPIPLMVSYDAAKAGLSGFSRGLMLEEAGRAITVIDFQPGDLRTAFNRRMRRVVAGSAREEALWQRMEELLAAAPGPQKAARRLVRALHRGNSGVVRAGGMLQCGLAPLAMRLLPVRMQLSVIRRYYGL